MRCLLITGLLNFNDFKSLVCSESDYSVCALLMKRKDLVRGLKAELENVITPDIYYYEDLSDLSSFQNTGKFH